MASQDGDRERNQIRYRGGGAAAREGKVNRRFARAADRVAGKRALSFFFPPQPFSGRPARRGFLSWEHFRMWPISPPAGRPISHGHSKRGHDRDTLPGTRHAGRSDDPGGRLLCVRAARRAVATSASRSDPTRWRGWRGSSAARRRISWRGGRSTGRERCCVRPIAAPACSLAATDAPCMRIGRSYVGCFRWGGIRRRTERSTSRWCRRPCVRWERSRVTAPSTTS